jgi:rhamnosyltransferase
MGRAALHPPAGHLTTSMPDISAKPAAVCAVIVTYHPDEDFGVRLRRVLPQVAATVIVDNGSSAAAAARLHDLSTSLPLTLIDNGENLGIARALNQGLRYALDRGYAWALLLDQDTVVDADLVVSLLAAYAACPDPAQTAAVGSRFRDSHDRPTEVRALPAQGESWREVEAVITSGTLLPLAAFTAIGPFREEFFIDYVDIDYCLRARAKGYRIIETRRALMSHTVGAPTRHALLGRGQWTTNHSAERRYYIARNNTVLLREYGTSKGGSWRWKSIVRSFRLCKRIALFEQDKLAKLVAVGEGWWDGMRGKLGPRAAAGRPAGSPHDP